MTPKIWNRHKPLAAVLMMAGLLAASGVPPAAQDRGTPVQGTIFNADGDPVPECRVVVRIADGTEVFISPPSDEEGRYSVAVPSGDEYVVVALVAPTGGRVAITESSRLVAAGKPLTRDVEIPMPVAPRPRKGGKDLGGVDRLFLAFVEDPAMAHRQHLEAQIGRADFNFGDLTVLRAIAAFQFASLPRVEIGLRGGYANIESAGGLIDDSGALDLDLWGKLHMLRSADTRLDMALGALVTMPTGDEDLGLGQDAFQSKIFVSLSYSLRSAVLVGHAGVRTTEDGVAAGLRRDGSISGSAGFGVLVPFSRDVSLAFEASYDGERFDGTDADSRVLFGANWKVQRHGKLRAALAGGLNDSSPDVELLVGYAVTF